MTIWKKIRSFFSSSYRYRRFRKPRQMKITFQEGRQVETAVTAYEMKKDFLTVYRPVPPFRVDYNFDTIICFEDPTEPEVLSEHPDDPGDLWEGDLPPHKIEDEVTSIAMQLRESMGNIPREHQDASEEEQLRDAIDKAARNMMDLSSSIKSIYMDVSPEEVKLD